MMESCADEMVQTMQQKIQIPIESIGVKYFITAPDIHGRLLSYRPSGIPRTGASAYTGIIETFGTSEFEAELPLDVLSLKNLVSI